jgi:4-hydroxy-3-methylbut-2-enyl diphosphate reductase
MAPTRLDQEPRPTLEILLASPRGYCAGVDRAIRIVEQALAAFGPPVYVRHDIVHNRHVTDALVAKGAVFVESVQDVPPGARLIYSAHGVSKAVAAEAQSRDLVVIDATCPLVAKVHHEVADHVRQGRQTVLIGHARHAEVEGTLGQVPPGSVHLVQTIEDIPGLPLARDRPVAVATQTTLSLYDTAAIVDALRRRFPIVIEPHSADVCYATTNRQRAVIAIARQCDATVVVGGKHSSNSRSLRDCATRAGCGRALLIECAEAMDWAWLLGVTRLGVTSGASTPEYLVEGFIVACRERYSVNLSIWPEVVEDVRFKLPRFPSLEHSAAIQTR